MDFELVTKLSLIIQRRWYLRERYDADLHPSVQAALKADRPKDWHLVVLQWPHVAEDADRLAYTQSDRKGEANLQTVTSIGKYLKQHWPHVPDHTVRDWVATYCKDEFEIWTTKEGIIKAAEFGPRSCMSSLAGYIPFRDADRQKLQDGDYTDEDLDKHPYATYDPKYGWAVAVRLNGGVIEGRALLNDKGFVRTYARAGDDNSRSQTDYKLEAWLQKEGYAYFSSWLDGTELAYIEHPREDGPLAPYLDGSNTKVTRKGNTLVIDDDGEYECDNTNGTATLEEDNSIGECETCGHRIGEDEDYSFVGRHEETLTCGHCVSRSFTWVRGYSDHRQGYREYYVEDGQAVEAGGHQYDSEELPDNIVSLQNGDYAELDDTVCIDGEYYLHDDYRVVYLEEDHEDDSCALAENTWVDGDGLRYHDDVECWEDFNGDKWKMDEEFEEVEGEKYRLVDIAAIRDAAQVAPLFGETA